MKQVIKIDLNKKEDVFEKYSNEIIDDELTNYIVDSCILVNENNQIELVINNHIGESYKDLIISSLQKEYNKGLISHFKDNTRQLVYLMIGVLLLFISSLIERTILKEIILIGAWVLIWEMMETVMFSYTNSRRRRNTIKKIIDGTIIENMINR